MKKVTIAFCILALLTLSATAQKLPNVQQTSVRAPANIKIDGKATEWKDQFQAYNNTTEIFYTLSNDNDKLYLTVQATDPEIITKIISGGITLTVNSSGNRKDKNGVAVSFPQYDKINPPVYAAVNNKPKPTRDTVKSRMQADSFMNVRNAQLGDKVKLIGVVGVKSIEDSVISMYNTEGIKAMALFDRNIYYTYELSVPLKLLGLSIIHPVQFSYNIQLNGPSKGGRIEIITRGGGATDILSYVAANGVHYTAGYVTPDNMRETVPTDFWGEYTLAKK